VLSQLKLKVVFYGYGLDCILSMTNSLPNPALNSDARKSGARRLAPR
jgi:hypothetical protein